MINSHFRRKMIARTLRKILIIQNHFIVRSAPKSTQKCLFQTASLGTESNANNSEENFEILRGARNKVQNVLGIQEIEAMALLSSNKKLLTATTELMSENLKVCQERGLKIKLLMKYPFLLSESKLLQKLEVLQKFPIKLKDSIPLARLSRRQLKNIVSNCSKVVQRVNDLINLFEVTPEEACDILAKKPFLIYKKLGEIEKLITFYHEYGFTKEDILNDLWILKYSEVLARNRFNFVRKHKISTLKTWMVRCTEAILYKHIKRESDNRDILGENSVAQYLSEKLSCNESIAKSLIKKHPQLEHKSLLTMTIMIDMLYKNGFMPRHICRVPKILLHSTKTTEARLKQLVILGLKPDSLYVLTKSQKQYLKYVENLLKTKAQSNNANDSSIKLSST